MERGAHSGTDAKIEVESENALRPRAEYDLRKTVPLATWAHAEAVQQEIARLPTYERLRAIDLHHMRATSLSALAARGGSFLRAARERTAAGAAKFDELRQAWLDEAQPS